MTTKQDTIDIGAAPLDCADLAAMLHSDATAATALLTALTPAQRLCQATAYAGYLNELRDLDLSVDDILTSWGNVI